MMKYRYFALFSIIFALTTSLLNTQVFASEILTKYKVTFITNPATGLRYDDGSAVIKNGFNGEDLGNFRGASTSVKFKFGGSMRTNTLDLNSPEVGYPDDCYPDDPANPNGNIIISGKIISNFTNKPVNGAAVAVYMGAEHLDNNGILGSDMPFNEKFVVSGKDVFGRLTNLYHYDVTKDGFYRVYACNGYKQLSDARKAELKKTLFKTTPCPDGYVNTGTGCNYFDYVKAYPKFSLAVICGMTNTRNSSLPSPIIGEIYSIDNFNDGYKNSSGVSFMQRQNFDIRVNCQEEIPSFPIPMNLEFASPNNVASCRMDDISPELRSYFSKVQEPLRNYKITAPPTNLIVPDEGRLPECTNPDDIYCLKNFITQSFQKPVLGKNIFNYGSKTYLSDVNVNPVIKDEILKYSTSFQSRKIDLSDGQPGDASDPKKRRNFLAQTETSSYGQFDAKIDVKSYIDDMKFDLSSLKDLYACFSTFNAPPVRTNAELDEIEYQRALANPGTSNYTPNLRIPSCKELYCGQEFVPDNKVCKVKKPSVFEAESYGNNFSLKESDKYIQLNALTGYGPGVTLSLQSQKDISKKLLFLVKDLIGSEFNPKKPSAGQIYKPVTKVSDIVACIDDNNQPIYLNESVDNEGSITYRVNGQQNTFYSPVPLMSFLSIPYNIELFHSIITDNYQNRDGQTNKSLFPEQCNGPDANQKFAECRSAVLPGGVYSVSALRLIADMCNNATKIPTPDAGVFNRVMGLTGKNTSSTYNNAVQNNGMDIELSVTKIGTPVSLCLCKPGDLNCNYNSRLNNSDNPANFAVSSFTGEGMQNNKNNYLGVKCENSFAKNTKNPVENCEAIAAANSNKNVPETDVNYLGQNNNLQVKWAYSYDTFDLGPDANHEWLTYTWDRAGGELAPNDSPQNTTANVRNVKSIWAGLGRSGFGTNQACIWGDANGCLSYPRLKLEMTDRQVSGISNIGSNLDTPIAPTEVREITYYDRGAGDANGNVKSPLKVVQEVRDGTAGYVKARMQLQNAKYDPIPDLLNSFRRYSVYGAVPGGEEYCRAPKLASIFDFKVYEYNSLNSSEKVNDIIFSRSKGYFCNAYIPEELKRCDDPKNWVADWEKSPQECRFSRCMSFCQQMVGDYNMFMDSATGNYYCLNKSPQTNVEMQLNQGDEGCVLDYVKRMRAIYANPAEVEYTYESVKNDPRYDKSNYPVYNNVLCQNPSAANIGDASYQLDGKNCMPFVGKKLLESTEINNTKFDVDIRIP